MFYRSETVDSHSHRLRRVLPVIALAAVAFVVGAIAGASHGPGAAEALADRFALAWAHGNYASVYRDLAPSSRTRLTPQRLAEDCRRARRIATATTAVEAGRPRGAPGGLLAVPMRVHTRLFGTLRLSFLLKVVDEGTALAWSRSAEFPGLRPGQRLNRHMKLPPRASLLARDGSVLAEGPASEAGERSSPLGAAASAAVGQVGPLPAASRQALEAEGVPTGAIVGVSGIERALDARLRGAPGGVLLAQSERPGLASQVLARAAPRPAAAVRTTISPPVQQAAVTALGDQLGGVVAMRPNGEILAVAGIGIDDLQPPGSTFKMVTVSGVLAAGVANPHSTFPYATYATLDGVKLSNANGEECGGSLTLAFAVSCNSVFAPLGVKLGAPRLVAMAERYGFNQAPAIPGAAESTLPAASQIQGELDLGSTAIGQGRVLASALQMGTVAATIADEGRRPRPSFTLGSSASAETSAAAATATSTSVARTVRELMIRVVREGTGTAAAIPGVTVAGKTGTAELGSASCSGPSEEAGIHEGSSEEGGCQGATSDPSNTDAWFAAFAPAVHPRVVVGVLLVKDGAGGATAAPVAREVLEAGLHATA
jgi:Penicillin binding protein transpeptidase domain/Penicillin-binding Protein dimerisation domain